MSCTEHIRYLYDGSFEGLLTCVYETVYSRIIPVDICVQQQAEPSLIQDYMVVSDKHKALRVFRSIAVKICKPAEQLVRDMFCSSMLQKEMLILRFLLFGYRYGKQAYFVRTHPITLPLYEGQRMVKNEVHMLKGFLRFSDYHGILVAKISPKNFVLPYLSQHFCARYAQEDFMIYDKTNCVALIWHQRRARLLPIEQIVLPEADEQELQCQKLWKTFFTAVAISERISLSRQRTHCPMRYWGDMTEMCDQMQGSAEPMIIGQESTPLTDLSS